MDTLFALSAERLFDEFDLFNPRIDVGLRVVSDETPCYSIMRNLTPTFDLEFVRCQQKERTMDTAKDYNIINKEAETIESNLIVKNELVQSVQRSFGIKLTEYSRQPLKNITNNNDSSSPRRADIPRPPINMNTRDDREHRNIIESTFLNSGSRRAPGIRSGSRREFSLNNGYGKSSILDNKASMSMENNTNYRSCEPRCDFKEFMKELKQKSILGALRKRKSQVFVHHNEQLFNTQKYDTKESSKYCKLKAYLHNNVESVRIGTSRSNEVDMFSNKHHTRRARDSICCNDEAPKTASTVNPSSTSRLKRITTFRDYSRVDADNKHQFTRRDSSQHTDNVYVKINSHVNLTSRIVHALPCKPAVQLTSSQIQFSSHRGLLPTNANYCDNVGSQRRAHNASIDMSSKRLLELGRLRTESSVADWLHQHGEAGISNKRVNESSTGNVTLPKQLVKNIKLLVNKHKTIR